MASIETAAIVTSDLVGSTKLETAVGPERADELRREHFDVLRQAIGETGGNEVKNTGDGLVVAFKAASAAVACAKAMHQLIDRRNRGADAELHIRIGIGMGEATIEEGDYFGMPSIGSRRRHPRRRTRANDGGARRPRRFQAGGGARAEGPSGASPGL
jgi:class 3 adenylate cyclase